MRQDRPAPVAGSVAAAVNAVRLLRRPSAAVVGGVIALAGLTGCSSTPGARRVALDMIETLSISEDAKACMTEKVEQYSADDLDRIAELADDRNQEGLEQLGQFEDDLATCMSAG
jgi:hypothetical protein